MLNQVSTVTGSRVLNGTLQGFAEDLDCVLSSLRAFGDVPHKVISESLDKSRSRKAGHHGLLERMNVSGPLGVPAESNS